jgi:hypothetical protein
MRCPKCGLENPQSGIHYDCGYNFRTGVQEPKRVASAGDANCGMGTVQWKCYPPSKEIYTARS